MMEYIKSNNYNNNNNNNNLTLRKNNFIKINHNKGTARRKIAAMV